MNPTTVGNYFCALNALYDQHHLTPSQIWNADETGIRLEHQPSRVVARAGMKSVPGRTGNNKESMTMMACINAAGDSVPPLFIIRGKTRRSLSSLSTEDGPVAAQYTFQDKAWMQDVLSTEWFEKVFLRHCGPSRPQLLIWDSHSSHETLEVLEKARQNDIIIFTFPPHTTHYLRPLDRCVFSPFQRAFDDECSKYMNACAENTVCKASVCGLLKKAYDRGFTRSNIVSGFESTGMWKFNPETIPINAFAPSQPFDTEKGPQHPIQHDQHPLSWANRKTTSPQAVHIDEHQTVTLNAQEPTTEAAVPENIEILFPDGHSEVFAVEPLDMEDTPATSQMLIPSASQPPDASLVQSSMQPSEASQPPSSFHPPDSSLAQGASQPSELALLPPTSQGLTQDPSLSWKSEVSVLFTPTPADQKAKKKNVNRRKVTSHRLLTSDEIITFKREEKRRKDELEKQKEERKKKRQQRIQDQSSRKGKNGKQKRTQTATSSESKTHKQPVIYKCQVCMRIYSENDEHSWIACDVCDSWMHQRCIPLYHQPRLQEAIAGEADFVCHVCTFSY